MRRALVGCGALIAAWVGLVPVNAEPPANSAQATGPSVSCLPLRSIRSTSVIDDRTIDFRTGGRKVYRNTLPFSCPQLGYQQAFSYATSQSQLCSVDIITVLVQGSPNMQGASCGLGRFTPLPPVTR